MRNRAIKGGVLLEIFLILVSIGFLSKVFISGIYTYKFIHLTTLVATDATIKNIRNHGFTLDIDFSLPNNEIVAIEQNVFVPHYTAGEHVQVIYNAEQPGAAAMNTPTALWFYPIVYVLPGLILLVWGLRLFTIRNL